MSILKRKSVTHESEIEVDGQIVTLTAVFETVGRIGSWKRQDYRQQAQEKVLGKDKSLDDKATFRAYYFHVFEASNIYGAMSSLQINGEEFDGDWMELFEEIPDPVIEEWIGQAYSLNPHWMPKSKEASKN